MIDVKQIGLPPYTYGRECSANEKVWPEAAVLEAQRLALTVAGNPTVMVEAAVLALVDGVFQIGLIPRGLDQKLGLVGGVVLAGEEKGAAEAVLRMLGEQLGLTPNHLEQAFTEAGPDRGVDGWAASVVYLALVPAAELQAMAKAGIVTLFPVWPDSQLPAGMALDHAELTRKALDVLASKAANSSIVAHFLPKVFSLSDLHHAYELLCVGRQVNAANFRRKVLAADFLEEADIQRSFGRPAQGYSLKQQISYFDKNIL
jgi:8-oxo-dGTP diphosphatase